MRFVDMVSFAIAVVISGAGAVAIAGHFGRRNGRDRLLLWFGVFAATCATALSHDDVTLVVADVAILHA